MSGGFDWLASNTTIIPHLGLVILTAMALALHVAGIAPFRRELGLPGGASQAVGTVLALAIWPMTKADAASTPTPGPTLASMRNLPLPRWMYS